MRRVSSWSIRSIAVRITIWYALSAFALVSAATGFLYWALASNLKQEDSRVLFDNLQNLRLLLKASPQTGPATPRTQAEDSAAGEQPHIYVRVLDYGGRILFETPGMSHEVILPRPVELPLTDTVQSRNVRSASGNLFQVLSADASPHAGGGKRYLQVAMDRSAEDQLLRRYRERLWLVLAASIIICSLFGYAIARNALRPVEIISRAAERIQSATLHERIKPTGLPAELSGLAETFNQMLDRLQLSFDRVSQFTDDVAHELRTPINNLRGEIEVALTRARSNEEYRDVLGSCLEECARISRIVQSLLFLTRNENTPGQLQLEVVDLRQEITAVKEFYEPAAAEAGVSLEIAAPATVTAKIDRTLFRQALGNLFSNALAHTERGGTIEITVDKAGLYATVAVRDTGCGIPPDHLPRVFERFYRVNKARSGSQQNVGLGLAIVKSIIARHGGHASITSRVAEGTTVTLEFRRT